ncbi:hypothetical protein GEMRC1_006440 [Eukaryota sp. GEM-RC1]
MSRYQHLDLRYPSKGVMVSSLQLAIEALQDRRELLTVGNRLLSGEIPTLSEVSSLFDNQLSRSEVTEILLSNLHVYIFYATGSKEHIVVPIAIPELLHCIASQYKNAVNSSNSSSPLKAKRGSYSCSVCGLMGHTKGIIAALCLL